MPGTFTDETVLVSGGAYLNILKGTNIRELLETRCGVPVAVENDGKAAALAECWNGNLKGLPGRHRHYPRHRHRRGHHP